jgi:hypothetical protein
VWFYFQPVFRQKGKVSHIHPIDAIQVGSAIRGGTVWGQPRPGKKSLQVFEINYMVAIQITYELRLGAGRTGQKSYQKQR